MGPSRSFGADRGAGARWGAGAPPARPLPRCRWRRWPPRCGRERARAARGEHGVDEPVEHFWLFGFGCCFGFDFQLCAVSLESPRIKVKDGAREQK